MNRKLNRYANLNDLLKLILDIDPQRKEAYYFLIMVDTFFRDANLNNAKQLLDSIISSAINSQVVEIEKFGHTLLRWREEIINSFYIITVVDDYGEVISRKINNGIAENKNALSQNYF